MRVEQGEPGAGVPEVEGDDLVPPGGVDEQDVQGVVPRHPRGDEAARGLVLPDGVRRRLRREEGEPRRETGHRAPRQHRRQRSLIDRRQCWMLGRGRPLLSSPHLSPPPCDFLESQRICGSFGCFQGSNRLQGSNFGVKISWGVKHKKEASS